MHYHTEITGEDGVFYTAIIYNNFLTLLSYETEDGTRFLVVEGLTEGENGLYTWGNPLYFDEDLLRAYYHIEGHNT